jgi:uncharacterized protein (TIGR00730 family)
MKSIGIYCGSSFGARPIYREKAEELGRLIGQNKMTLVYGGGNAGLMGVLASSVLAGGGKVISVIPRFIRDKVGLVAGSEELLTETMHERKQLILDRSDGIVAFPGGIGTMDEFFEAYTWSQLGLLQKPVAIYNLGGYYDTLLDFLDNQVREGFLKPIHRGNLITSVDPRILLENMDTFRYNYTGKWTDQIKNH